MQFSGLIPNGPRSNWPRPPLPPRIDGGFQLADAATPKNWVQGGILGGPAGPLPGAIDGVAMTDLVAHTPPRSRSFIAAAVAKLVALCGVIPYALVALGLRLVMARVFFLSGQPKIEGPVIPVSLNIRELDFLIVLPAQIKDATFRLFETQYAALPIPPTVAAYLFTYAEFILPVCLVIGFATRIAALGLLVMIALIQIYVMPDLWWTTHVYWVAILLVLMSVGPGAVSIDALIRYLYER
jgi:putative oxidoreductase